jgi:hypothetical protein
MSTQDNTTKQFLKDKRNALERIDALENMFPNLIQALGRQIDSVKNKQNFLDELMDAIIGTVGAEKVAESLKDSRLQRALKEAESQKESTAKAVAEGKLKTAEIVGDNSVIVISSNNTATGESVGAGWFRFHVSEIKPEVKAMLVGQSVGFEGTEGGNTFKLLEIYDVAAPAAVAVEVTDSEGQ